MKKNSGWAKLNSSPNLDYILLGGVLAFCLAYRFWYFGVLYPYMLIYNSDSVTYFTSGFFDLYRTPAYPLLLNFFELLSRDNFIKYLIFFQQAVSFLSIIPFFYCTIKIVQNRFIAVFSTIFYGCWHYLLFQNVNINPECLSIAGSTMTLFLFISYVQTKKKRTIIFLVFFTFILIMLKPTYLILLVILLVFLVARIALYKEEKKTLYWGLSSWFMAVLGIIGYCQMNSKLNGEFVLSKIALTNSIANSVISGAYKFGGDQDFISIIDSTKKQGFYTSAFLINNQSVDNYKICIDRFPKHLTPTKDMIFCSSIPNTVNFSSERIHKFINKSKVSAPFLFYILKRCVKMVLFNKILSLFIMCEFLIIFNLIKKHKIITWIIPFCILFVLAQFLTIIIGGIEDWDRLLIPSYPMIIIIIASFLSFLILSIKKRNINTVNFQKI